jgi:hypothetical protein
VSYQTNGDHSIKYVWALSTYSRGRYLYEAPRSAARHEVEKQGQRNAQIQMAAERNAKKKRHEKEERDRRTQLAIDEALAKERSKNEQKLAVDAAAARSGQAAQQP